MFTISAETITNDCFFSGGKFQLFNHRFDCFSFFFPVAVWGIYC